MTKNVKMKNIKNKSLGMLLKNLREDKKLPLRTVAAFLDIDQAILSKIENGKRKANRKQVVALAQYFNINENELLISWLSDKLIYEIKDEQIAFEALTVAEEKMKYFAKLKSNKNALIESIKSLLKKDGRVSSAWLFGSFARDENKSESDIDIMVELNNNKKYSLFDLMDISFLLESKLNKKVDLVEKGYLKDFALETASKDLIKIYG